MRTSAPLTRPAAAAFAPEADPAAWAWATFGQARLGDQRRTRRLVQTATRLATQPAASLPQQLQDPAALKATYRLLGEPDVTLEALLAPHLAQTRTAAAQEAVVLLVQDTTEIDYTHHPQTTGLGPIGDGRGRGYHLQTVLAIRPAPRQVLGIAHAAPFLRQPAPRRGERSDERQPRPRESDIWAQAATAIGPPLAGSRWVHVGDCGADVFTFLTACRAQGADFLVRAAQDRRAEAADATRTRLLTAARALPAQADRELRLAARPGRAARTLQVALAWTAATVLPPAQAAAPKPAPLPVWVIRAWERDPPPAGAEPVEWVLVTSVPTATVADAWERVDWYTRRWLVEEYHRCLKTGCRLEAAQLRERNGLWRLLGVLAPLAVRLLQLREAVRATPDAPATSVVPAAVVRLVAARTGLPAAVTVEAFWRQVARLGGHLGRTRDGPPGWQTLWLGWRYVLTLLEGAHLASSLTDDRCG